MYIKLIIILAIFLSAIPSHAAKLFGVDLISASKADLRKAAMSAGARLKKEAGEFDFYDEYFSADILKDSELLFLGYDKKTEKFVFAEYEFKGLNHEKMLRKLSIKYGAPKKIKQVFISDTIYRWTINGVEISYYKDWYSYKTRVTYIVPNLLAQLKIDRKKVKEAITRGELNKQSNVY